MSLADVQRTLHALFRGQTQVEAAAEALGVDPARLAIYRDFVAGHVRSVLDKNYVYLRRLFEPARWDELTRGYFLAHPSRDWELNQAARGFGDFLEAERAAGRAGVEAFHVVLAAFEWEELATYLSETELPVPATGRIPNPTLSVLELPFDVPGFIATHGVDEMSPATPLPALLSEPLACVMYRDPADLYTRWEAVTPELAFALKVAAEGLSDEAAARGSGEPLARVRELIADAAERGVILSSR